MKSILFDPNNHLFNLARSGQRLPHILLAIPLAFAIILLAIIGGGLVAALLVGALSVVSGEVDLATFDFSDSAEIERLVLPDTALEQVIFLVLSFGPIFLILWLWLYLFEKRPLWSTGLEWRQALWHYGRGLLVGLLMFTAAIGISALFGYIAFEDGDPQRQGFSALLGVLFVFIGWMVQGAAEELITRGWLLPVIGARYSPTWGIIISSLIFMIFHARNPNLSIIALLNLFLFGLFATLYALYEGGLWGSLASTPFGIGRRVIFLALRLAGKLHRGGLCSI